MLNHFESLFEVWHWLKPFMIRNFVRNLLRAFVVTIAFFPFALLHNAIIGLYALTFCSEQIVTTYAISSEYENGVHNVERITEEYTCQNRARQENFDHCLDQVLVPKTLLWHSRAWHSICFHALANIVKAAIKNGKTCILYSVDY